MGIMNTLRLNEREKSAAEKKNNKQTEINGAKSCRGCNWI